MKKLCTFTPELADKIAAYQKRLGLKSFQASVEVICGTFLAEPAVQQKEKKPA